MLVILGGMLYDNEMNRAVRKRYLPEPNPQIVELSRNAKLNDVYEKAKELYFMEFEADIDSFSLVDSGGLIIPVSDVSSWTLATFYQKNNLQPSRYKLYVALKDVPIQSEETPTKLIHTECVMSSCVECNREFRTYVPETICKLPDGGSVYYRDPQNLCPLCDPIGFGEFMNKDLFPELCGVVSQPVVEAANESEL